MTPYYSHGGITIYHGDVVSSVEADLRAYENWSWETAEPGRAIPTMTEIEQCCNEDTVRMVETWLRELVRRVHEVEDLLQQESEALMEARDASN